MDRYIAEGGEAFSVSRFGYEYLKEKVDLEVIEPEFNKIENLLIKYCGSQLKNILIQFRCLKRAKDNDVIYWATDRHPIILIYAKRFGLLKKPILMVSHFTFNLNMVADSKKQKFLRWEREKCVKYFEQIVFASENLLKVAKLDYNYPDRQCKWVGWGADISYFKRKSNATYFHYDFPFFLAAGGINRDYKTLVEAFYSLPYHLVLSCPREVINMLGDVPDNIHFYNMGADGYLGYEKLRELYQKCEAVCIPVAEKNHVPNGASVLVESLACGKPVFATDLESNFIDIRGENVGDVVRINCSEDWKRAINQFVNLSDQEKKEMGERAYILAKTKYNYKKFSDEVYEYIKKLVKK